MFQSCYTQSPINYQYVIFKWNFFIIQRRLDRRHVTIFYQSDSSLNMLMADPENFPKVRVVAVFFGFLLFVFNELCGIHPNGLMWRYSFLRSRVFEGEFVVSADFLSVFWGSIETAFVSRVLGVMFSNRCFVFFPLLFASNFCIFL